MILTKHSLITHSLTIGLSCLASVAFAAVNVPVNSEFTISEEPQLAQLLEPRNRVFSGHRIGAGISQAAFVDANMFVFDYGYEFNRYIGFTLSGSNYDENYLVQTPEATTSWQYDGAYTRIASDVGYTFVFNAVDIKPYVSIGLLYLNESDSFKSYSELAFQYGAGLRATLWAGVYIDGSVKVANLDKRPYAGSVLNNKRPNEEVTLTAGYKF